MTDVLFLRGTTERPGPNGTVGGLLAEVAARLDPFRYTPRDLDYPASIGPANPQHNPLAGASMQESINRGVYALSAAVTAAREPVGLVGYSLGAMTISRYLEAAHETGSSQVDKIAFVGLVANPLRAEGDSIDGRAQGWGIAGQHGPWPTLPVFEIANPDDAITACPPNSPLRYLADGLTYAQTTDMRLWGNDVLTRLRMGGWQGARPKLADYAKAVTDLYGYLFGGTHIGAYSRPDAAGVSQLGELARLINATPDVKVRAA